MPAVDIAIPEREYSKIFVKSELISSWSLESNSIRVNQIDNSHNMMSGIDTL